MKILMKRKGFIVLAVVISLLVGLMLASSVATAADEEEAITVEVGAGEDQTSSPGGSVTLEAVAVVGDESTVIGYQWTQISGTPATMKNANAQTATVILADLADYRTELFHHLETPDRFMVQGINPHSLEATEEAVFEVAVTTSSGVYTDTVSVMAHLPYAVSTGVRNVPIDVPVLLHGKTQDAYDWDLLLPSGSKALLDDSAVRNPSFTPDVAGRYTLTEMNSGVTLHLYGGTWLGVIVGQDEIGEPVSDEACTACHNNPAVPDKFSVWKASGHAEIVSVAIDDPHDHWSVSCATCHSPGYDTEADNDGWDEIIAEEGWTVGPAGAVGNWAKMLADYPATARLANIQCENCHGPQETAAHGQADARTSLASDVCATCHGEPTRHGRFQQWEESNHADYTLAIERATNASCGRCHVAQGFLAWLPQLEEGNSGNIEAEITWTAETAEPVTCTVCHDPHDVGKTTGPENTANVRIEGNTSMLPAGFKVIGAGRGALCMTCHNSRNGEHNDAAMPVADDRVPHTAAQADVLMGENAYFVSVGQRSPHSLIEDTCTKCHMVLSPAPPEFSRKPPADGSGTNHEFGASSEICTSCHGAFTGGTLDDAVHGGLEELKLAMEVAITKEVAAQTSTGNTVVLKAMGPDESDVNISNGSVVTAVESAESHGRQAMNITVDGVVYEHVRLASDTDVVDSAGNSVGTLLASDAGQIIAKAGWNYFLIEGDGSEGVHNPSFTLEVVRASVDALK